MIRTAKNRGWTSGARLRCSNPSVVLALALMAMVSVGCGSGGATHVLPNAAPTPQAAGAPSTANNAPTQQACIKPPSGLVGWWPGDGNANDLLGQHNGVVEGGLTFAPAEVADGFDFNGIDASVDFGNAGDFARSDFTVVFWLNGRSSSHRQAVIEKRPICNHGPFYGIRMDPAGCLLVETDDGQGNYVILYTKKVVNDGTFHLIALQRRGTTTSLYIDGTLDTAKSTAAVAAISSSAPLTAGKSICEGIDGTVHFGGLLDEIQAFARALSETEIQAIHSAGQAGECKEGI